MVAIRRFLSIKGGVTVSNPLILGDSLTLATIDTTNTPGTIDREYATDSTTGKLARWSATPGIWTLIG